MNIVKTLRTLTETPGPAGFEAPIAAAIQKIWEPLVDDMTTDRVGNLIATKRGSGTAPRRRILLAAHMDEIGLMAAQVVDHKGQGFLRVTNLGGVDRRHLIGQLVTIHGKRDLTGVIGALPASMLPSERGNTVYTYEEFVVDPGLSYADLKELVSIGDAISFRQPLRKLQGKVVTAKAMDNRASVTAVTVALHALQTRQHNWDVVAVATSQEETRLLGAYTSAFSQYPDAAIAIDVCFASGGGVSDLQTFELGAGPVLDIGPNVHPGMYDGLKKAAQTLELTVHDATHTRGSGTDAYGLQVARAGIPTGLISIPVRYMHTMVETIHTSDIERAGRLMAEFITTLEADFVEQLEKSMMNEED